MVLVFFMAGTLLVLGGLAYVVAQWPEQGAVKKKKEKKEKAIPPVPQKDVSEISERFERRVRTLENSLQAAQNETKDKLKEIAELKAAVGGLERQNLQEKTWREKEESLVAREKQNEQALRAELNTTREALHAESNQRIRLEYEVKELKLVRDSLSSDVRKLTGQNNDIERRLNTLTDEARALRSENSKLKIKKEGNEWVSKDDYDKLEKLLKRTRSEVDQLKKRLPEDLREVKDKDE